ncbi:hypothetical protein GT354_13750 [Streptomyces sp. SID3343]|nr:hypothetical protein [Streptomyces sp. SID3343]
MLHPYALLGGLVTLALLTFHGAAFAALKTTGDIRLRCRRYATVLGLTTAGPALTFLLWTQALNGGAGSLVALIVTLAALLGSPAVGRAGRDGWAFGLSGTAVVAAVTMLFLVLFPDVMPSSTDPRWSLTAADASANPYALKVMTWLALVVTPVVIAYQAWTYWVFRRRIGTQHIPQPG